jgi:hypothetical protein
MAIKSVTNGVIDLEKENFQFFATFLASLYRII